MQIPLLCVVLCVGTWHQLSISIIHKAPAEVLLLCRVVQTSTWAIAIAVTSSGISLFCSAPYLAIRSCAAFYYVLSYSRAAFYTAAHAHHETTSKHSHLLKPKNTNIPMFSQSMLYSSNGENHRRSLKRSLHLHSSIYGRAIYALPSGVGRARSRRGAGLSPSSVGVGVGAAGQGVFGGGHAACGQPKRIAQSPNTPINV